MNFKGIKLSFQTQCSYGDPDGLEFALDGRMYELEYQVVDGDMDPPEYALAGSDMTTQGIIVMLCIASSSESLTAYNTYTKRWCMKYVLYIYL